MENEEKVEAPEVVNVEPAKKVKKIKPEVDYKKRCKELENTCAELTLKVAAAENLIESYKLKLDADQKCINSMVDKFGKITKYIEDATRVYHKSVLMMLEEGPKND